MIRILRRIAAEYEVSPMMVLKMKVRVKDRIEDVFQDERTRKKRSKGEATQEELFEQIGHLKMEVDRLKKQSAQYPLRYNPPLCPINCGRFKRRRRCGDKGSFRTTNETIIPLKA